MKNVFEQPIGIKESLLNELMIKAKQDLYQPKHINAITGAVLEEMRDEENFEAEALAKPELIQRWVDILSPYTQTLAKQSYELAAEQEDQFKEFGKTIEEIFWDEFKMQVRNRMKQQLSHREAA